MLHEWAQCNNFTSYRHSCYSVTKGPCLCECGNGCHIELIWLEFSVFTCYAISEKSNHELVSCFRPFPFSTKKQHTSNTKFHWSTWIWCQQCQHHNILPSCLSCLTPTWVMIVPWLPFFIIFLFAQSFMYFIKTRAFIGLKNCRIMSS